MMTIGNLIAALQKFDPDATVEYDFAGCVPTTVRSWRGLYAEPALGWRPTGYSVSRDNVRRPTVADLTAELRDAIGRPHEGWKGGVYYYTAADVLHVDNPGDSNYTFITRVTDHEGDVVLHTCDSGGN